MGDYLDIARRVIARRHTTPALPETAVFTPYTGDEINERNEKRAEFGLQPLSDGAWFCDGCFTKFWLAEDDTHTCPDPKPGAVKPHTIRTGAAITLSADVLAIAEELRQQARAGRAEYQRRAARNEVITGGPAYKNVRNYFDIRISKKKGYYRFTGQPRYFSKHGILEHGFN